MSDETATWRLLAWAVYPLWLASGALDYLCHRRDRIETSTGQVEPALHLLQAALVGAGVALVLWLRLTQAVMWTLLALALLHTLAAWIDLRWSAARRTIGAAEQLAHAGLIGFPFVALALLWSVFLAGDESGWRWREPPLAPGWQALVLGTGFAFAVAPALREWRRAARAARA